MATDRSGTASLTKAIREIERRRERFLASAVRHQATLRRIGRRLNESVVEPGDETILIVPGGTIGDERVMSRIADLERKVDALLDVFGVDPGGQVATEGDQDLFDRADAAADKDTSVVVTRGGDSTFMDDFLTELLNEDDEVSTGIGAKDVSLEPQVRGDVLRMLADLDFEPQAEPPIASEETHGDIGLVVERRHANGSATVNGIVVPAGGMPFIADVARDAQRALNEGTTGEAPSVGPYRAKWRRLLWQALVSTPTPAATEPHDVAQAVGDAVLVPRIPLSQMEPSAREVLDATQSMQYPVDVAELPPPPAKEEMAVLVRNMMIEKFPAGASTSQIISMMGQSYDVSARRPNYWWNILVEGQFDLDRDSGIWRARA